MFIVAEHFTPVFRLLHCMSQQLCRYCAGYCADCAGLLCRPVQVLCRFTVCRYCVQVTVCRCYEADEGPA